MTGECHPTDIRDEAFGYYRRLGRVERFCELRIAEPISLAQAAAVCGLERTYFSSFFHDKVGVCFSCWLAHRRVVHAKRLLRLHNESVSRTSRAVGFGSLSSFERAFKRSTGMTASAFRASARPNGSGPG